MKTINALAICLLFFSITPFSQYNNDWDGSNVPDGVYFGVVGININNQIVTYPFNVTILHGK